MKVYTPSKVYTGHDCIIPAIRDEWLGATFSGDGPVLGWPAEGSLKIYFEGHIPADEHEIIKEMLQMHFDGTGKDVVFPILWIEITTDRDDDAIEEGITAIELRGNPERAKEMIRPYAGAPD